MSPRTRSFDEVLGVALALALGTVTAGCEKPSAPDDAGARVEPPVPVPSTVPPPKPAPPIVPLSPGARTEDEANTISVFKAAGASAAFVTQKRAVFDYFAGRVEVPAGSGSAFVWDEEGHIVTNYHVIHEAQSLTVTLQDHSSHDAEVRGVEPRKDIAVLKIKAPKDKLHPIRKPAVGELIEVGQKTIAIGNPFGLDQTLTVGVVSALGRAVDGIGGVTIRDMIQTDAAINPGNSGGPLLDSQGRLLGMNTAIYSKSGTSAGVGFAVPANTILRVVPQIIRTGHAEQVGLGVRVDNDQRIERRLGVQGVAIISVQKGTPAEAAGLRGMTLERDGIVPGDIIVGINDERVKSYDDLYNVLDKYRPGDKVNVRVLRGKDVVTVPIALIVVQ
ncbi:MAG TPA: trypsin-like peptidase domain-containing protein [Polyangiaceae bacterium]|nr:trypsin-like peptidase domain-containing protein [Polyangiaceae bacterium]